MEKSFNERTQVIRKIILFSVFLNFAISQTISAYNTEWQWSTSLNALVSNETKNHPQAFLWIPSNCKQVRAVIVGNHNMTEETLLENPEFRKAMSNLGFAEIWITPGLDMKWDIEIGTQQIFETMMKEFATISGYSELEYAPIVPVGHSAMATYPWNFAAWNPERTLAILSVHGDAPQTNLTGYGKANLDWGKRTVDDIPGLMIEGEWEWWEDRVTPALTYRMKHPASPVSFLCDAGRGHFDISDQLVHYVTLFLEKAAQYRLPKRMPLNKPCQLIPVVPQQGWLAERWKTDGIVREKPAPYTQYKGNPADAFWYFDKEMALATEKIYARGRGKKQQYIGILQKGKLVDFHQNTHARIKAQFKPEGEEELTFHLKAVFTDSLRAKQVNEHAMGKPRIDRICGPVKKLNDSTFQISFYRMGMMNTKRTNDIWLLASHDGDENYKSSVQQLELVIPYRLTEGKAQNISFAPLKNVKRGCKSVALTATSDCGLPIHYYIEEGPAEIKDGKILFTKISPRAKLPLKVTVVAWQYGRSIASKVQTAEPVAQSFCIE